MQVNFNTTRNITPFTASFSNDEQTKRTLKKFGEFAPSATYIMLKAAAAAEVDDVISLKPYETYGHPNIMITNETLCTHSPFNMSGRRECSFWVLYKAILDTRLSDGTTLKAHMPKLVKDGRIYNAQSLEIKLREDYAKVSGTQKIDDQIVQNEVAIAELEKTNVTLNEKRKVKSERFIKNYIDQVV